MLSIMNGIQSRWRERDLLVVTEGQVACPRTRRLVDVERCLICTKFDGWFGKTAAEPSVHCRFRPER